ncbi:MAG: DNA primase [Gammaproteobacteria bacterium]|nr:DNA primase [Gammaproteobacteria bacterium]
MAGRIPRSFIDDLLARVDIVDVIASYVSLRKAGRNHQALCPFHDEKTPSFTVSQEKQFYHCFGCGANGTVISFVMEYNGLGFPEAVEDLAARYNLEVPREAGRQPDSGRNNELYELLGQAAQFYRGQLQGSAGRATAYLKKRGISGAVIKDYEIGYAPQGWKNLVNSLGKSAAVKARLEDAGLIRPGSTEGHYDFFRDRIMFPIRDQRGRIIGFGGRVLGDDTPKYLNSPDSPLFHKGRELYGLYQVLQKKKKPERLYIVEGYMDVVALAQFGIDNAVATLGTAATEYHLEKLFRVTSQIVFCFDGDEAGNKAAWRALEITVPQLREGRQALFSFMPEGDDPDSFVRRHGAERFLSDENTVPLSDFLLDHIKSGTGTTTRENRAMFLDRIRPHLAKMPGSGLRQLLLEEVAEIAQLDTDSVLKLLQDSRPDTARRLSMTRPRQQREKTGDISVIIAYILNKPELAMLVEEPGELTGLSVPGIEFLTQLVTLVHTNPEMTCAGILEHWRDSRYEQRLNELASAPVVPEEESFDVEHEFIARIEKLKTARARQSVDKIIRSKKPSELTDEEKEEFDRYTEEIRNK